MIEAVYRQDYVGEYVVVSSKWSGGKKTQEREWVDNPITNHHISGRAVCIANDHDQYLFDHTRLQRHRGGLLGSKKVQTYGTQTVAQQMRLDFAVVMDQPGLDKLAETNYHDANIVYTTASLCLKNPGLYYLIPYNRNLLDLVACVYLAAFDGHKEIFLLGYHSQAVMHDSHWIRQLYNLVTAYSSTIFYLVGHEHLMPDDIKNKTNVKTLSHRDFVIYADV